MLLTTMASAAPAEPAVALEATSAHPIGQDHVEEAIHMSSASLCRPPNSFSNEHSGGEGSSLEPLNRWDRPTRNDPKGGCVRAGGLIHVCPNLLSASALHNTSAIRYTQFLRALHEPSLFELASHDPNAQAYRLLWMRDSDRPASIRFVIKPSGTEWFYRHDGRYRINAADWLARERNVLVLEIAHGFFSEDGR